jgi:hypothetical protein
MARNPRQRRLPLPDPVIQPTLDVPVAGQYLDFGRAKSYQEAARYIATGGAEGLPVIKFGKTLKVPTMALLKLLSLDGTDAS